MQKNENTNMTGLLSLMRGLLVLLDAVFVFMMIMFIPGVSGEKAKPEQFVITGILIGFVTMIIVLLTMSIKKKRAHLAAYQEPTEIPELPFFVKSKNFNPLYNVMMVIFTLVALSGIPLTIIQSFYFLIMTGVSAILVYFLYREKLKLDFQIVFTVDSISFITKIDEVSCSADLITEISSIEETINVKNVQVQFKTIKIVTSDNKKIVIDGRRINYPIDLLYQAIQRYYHVDKI